LRDNYRVKLALIDIGEGGIQFVPLPCLENWQQLLAMRLLTLIRKVPSIQ